MLWVTIIYCACNLFPAPTIRSNIIGNYVYTQKVCLFVRKNSDRGPVTMGKQFMSRSDDLGQTDKWPLPSPGEEDFQGRQIYKSLICIFEEDDHETIVEYALAQIRDDIQ